MTNSLITDKCVSALRRHADMMVKMKEDIYRTPELGFREWKTCRRMQEAFEALGYTAAPFGDIPGFTALYDSGREGPTLLLLAELDAILSRTHRDADPESGAVHACGHDLQCAALLGAAAALRELSPTLSGRIKFCLVPAEEGIEIGFRASLVEEGRIRYTSGKPELIARGLLDDVDIAFMVHVANLEGTPGGFLFQRGCNGVIRKRTVIRGRASHAGEAPDEGVNALFAAELVLSATNALRETFREQDRIRFHSIITEGGESVNTVPERVVLESYVRGASPLAMREANEKINRAIAGACLSIGAEVTVTDTPGSEPRMDSLALRALACTLAEQIAGKDACTVTDECIASSTDMGDISCLVPSVHAYVDGHRGHLHGSDYTPYDTEGACIRAAALQLSLALTLLGGEGAQADAVLRDFAPAYPSVQDYLAAKDAIRRTTSLIAYDKEGARVTWR